MLRSELKREIAEIRETFATPRRTEVLRSLTDGDIEDLIPLMKKWSSRCRAVAT